MNIKGVIVAAGYGSRFLPATKTIPKEMLPLIDRPAMAFIVDEFLQSGIEDILIITSRRKKVLEDYFDHEIELERLFVQEPEKLQKIQPPRGRFFFVRQKEMKGTGHAIMLAKPFTGGDPFVVAYPDDIVLGVPPLSLQLIEAYRQSACSVLAVKDMSGSDVSRYGVVDPRGGENPCPVRRLVEKPAPGQEPSNLVSQGRYLFTAEIYSHLEAEYRRHKKGEFYHVGAINRLAENGRCMALAFSGERLDTGEPLGFLEATCRYALSRTDLREKARTLFHKLSRETADSSDP